jgi:predicted anti-sigma-YlaC factor YlaD
VDTEPRAQIACRDVRRELVNYMEDDLTPELRATINRHLQGCAHCTAIYDGARNVVRLIGSKDALELPPGLSRRLYERFLSRIK